MQNRNGRREESEMSDLPMGPTGFFGLNWALKQMWVLKHECLRPLTSQGLLKMLILSGSKVAARLTEATPRDLRAKHNPVIFQWTWPSLSTLSLTAGPTKAAPLCHMHRPRCQGWCRRSGLYRSPETFQSTGAEGPGWSQEFSEIKVHPSQW